MSRVVIIANQAVSLINFRGPIIQEIVKRGHDVIALAPDYNDISRSRVRDTGASPTDYCLSRTGLNPLRDVWDFLNLIRLIKSLRPDMTLAYSIKPVIYGTLASWVSRVPKRFALIEGLGYVFTEAEKKLSAARLFLRTIVLLMYKLALSKATRVLFLNRDDLTEFTWNSLVSTNKAYILGPIGVDLKNFVAALPVKNPITFIFVGRLLKEKGLYEFVEAARQVRSQYPDTQFLILGDSDTNPGSIKRKEVEGWVRAGLVEWPGHVEDVRPWLARASVFVLPSYREGVPRSTQEAMAMARPVITTDVPGCRETVIHGVNGFLVPTRDVGSLARAMERFIQEPELIERLGKESRRLAEERFDVVKINRRFLSILFEDEEFIKKVNI